MRKGGQCKLSLPRTEIKWQVMAAKCGSPNPAVDFPPTLRITRVCLLVYTSATSRLSLSVPSSRLSPSPVSLESRLTLSTSSRHIAFIYHFSTHPPITRTIGREESMEMGFIRPHPHRLFALESGRRSSSRPAFTPTYTTVVYLCTHVARGQYTRYGDSGIVHASLISAAYTAGRGQFCGAQNGCRIQFTIIKFYI